MTPNLTAGSIVVRVELHSAGQVSEIARMHIAHVGGNGGYEAATMHGRDKAALDLGRQQRGAVVSDHPRLTHVWQLVARALIAMGYSK